MSVQETLSTANMNTVKFWCNVRTKKYTHTKMKPCVRGLIFGPSYNRTKGLAIYFSFKSWQFESRKINASQVGVRNVSWRVIFQSSNVHELKEFDLPERMCLNWIVGIFLDQQVNVSRGIWLSQSAKFRSTTGLVFSLPSFKIWCNCRNANVKT